MQGDTHLAHRIKHVLGLLCVAAAGHGLLVAVHKGGGPRAELQQALHEECRRQERGPCLTRPAVSVLEPRVKSS